MSRIYFKIKGTSPLVMNNGEKADPDGEYMDASDAIRKKRNKSPAEREELGFLEFKSGLYMTKENGPSIPDQNLIACLVSGGAPQKLGKEINAYVSIDRAFAKIDYDGPRTPEKMWAAAMYDRRLVSGNGRPGGPKVIRYRPLIKPGYTIEFEVLADDELDPKQLIVAMNHAGKRVGLCERAKFRWGRFEVEKAEIRSS